jgi:acyl carrier protein
MSSATIDLEDTIRGHLVEMFEVDPLKISRESRLFEDLALDSIDAVDLIVKLQDVTGRRFKPEEFKGVRTFGDILERVDGILKG